MNWNYPDWLDEYDIVTASSPEELLKQLNRDGQIVASEKCKRWQAIGFVANANGQYFALRRREVWASPKND